MIRTKVRLCILAAAAAALAVLAGCAKQTVVAMQDVGVCYSLGQKADGSLDYHPIKTDLAQMEQCAAALENMRRSYLALGSTNDETMGAFGGKFIFLMKDGIYTSKTLEGDRYIALVRTDDGRLVIPGAIVRQ